MSRWGLPDPGDIVRINRHAHRVLAAAEIDESYVLEIRILTGPDTGKNARATVPRRYLLKRLDEHFPVCHSCGEVPPCLESEQERYAREQARRTEARMSVPDGCCMACSEPISTRQKTLRFPGANVWNPFGAPGVRFHARQACRGLAAEYEEAWVQAEGGRERSLLTLKCSGSVIVHQDGTADCVSRNDGTDCPNIYAQHRYYAACYCSSYGCGLKCTQEGHPGARPAKGLTPNGDFPL
jgi:hypothetical protein